MNDSPTATTTTSTATPRNPPLPEELYLQILSHLPLPTLWRTIHPASPLLARLAEDTLTRTPLFLSKLTVAHALDFGATLTFCFLRFASPQEEEEEEEEQGGACVHALFGACLVAPLGLYAPAVERWRELCTRGSGVAGLAWRVQWGYEGEVKVLWLKGARVAAEGRGVWVEWRGLLDLYFGREGVTGHVEQSSAAAGAAVAAAPA
ncbi:hypothetical protein LTR08_008858 [Meristemomyces frigidus]|nr:hypothetical protein LTR08_008858 [Meristemomyces frigidus]